jgi:transposase InsO family protein
LRDLNALRDLGDLERLRGVSGDNAAMEGFFGRLKQEWLNHGDFCNMDYDAIVSSLEKYFAWYNERRIQSNLKTNPKIYREKLALLAQA